MVHVFTLELDKIHLHSQSVRYTTIGGKARSFPIKEYTQFKQKVAKDIMEQITLPIDKEAICSLNMTFFYAIPKSYSKIKRTSLQGQYKESSPDIDNICKSMLDSFTGILYNDDKQIVQLQATKKYGYELQTRPVEVEIRIEYKNKKEPK